VGNPNMGETRSMPLPPGVQAFMQNTTDGHIKTHVGPIVMDQTGQERPVAYNAKSREFYPVDLQEAVSRCIKANEGDYVVLHNPAVDGEHPNAGKAERTPALALGESVNIPGPVSFPLWPEQSAKVVPGHKMRSNQYVIARVVNGAKAKENWKESVIQTDDAEDGELDKSKLTFTTGSLVVIKGTEAKFFIPCTGMQVEPDQHQNYVRDAMTLERLEFCVLVSEKGEKRYERGPQVVFPNADEVFWSDDNGNKKFRAYELNEQAGIYLKAIAEYKDSSGEIVKPGQELFITGKEKPIFFPKPEQSIIRYGDEDVHYATAIPLGEGRYVLDRNTGAVRTEVGPSMLLPDPRKEVIVRRILSATQCRLWYPGNHLVARYNEAMREKSTTGKMGFMREDEVKTAGGITISDDMALEGGHEDRMIRASASTMRSYKSAKPQMADQMKRKTSYTPPRSIVLDSGLDGAVAVGVWTGYAVMVVGKDGSRKAVEGPETVLLDYDQTLEILRVSTGKPKNTDELEDIAYLRVSNNKVSDIVQVHTSDHVAVKLKLSYRVNFTGDPNKWFNVENYVKLLCDHCRSMLKGAVKRMTIQEFYDNPIGLTRDVILGEPTDDDKPRTMTFDENGMSIIDVDVLGVQLEDRNVAQELDKAQHDALQTTIRLQTEQRQLEAKLKLEEIERTLAHAKADTKHQNHLLEMSVKEDVRASQIAEQSLQQDLAKAQMETKAVVEDIADLSSSRELARQKAILDMQIAADVEKQEMELKQIAETTKAVVERYEKAGPGLQAALTALQSHETARALGEACAVPNLIGGGSLVDTIKQIVPTVGPIMDSVLAGMIADGEGGGLETIAGGHVGDE